MTCKDGISITSFHYGSDIVLEMSHLRSLQNVIKENLINFLNICFT